MKATLVSILVFAGLGLVSGQDFSGLPKCAQGCAESSIPQSCNLDVKCICSAQSFITSITCCVATACEAADQQSTLQFAEALCGGVGVTNLPTAASCASTGSGASSTPAPTGSGASSNGTVASITSAASATASSASATAASASANSGGASSTASASASSSSGAADRILVQQGMGILGLGVGVAAFL